jgi:amphiphysin
MQRAQRTFGRFLKRAPNEADVESMLTDFTDSEQMLEKVCESTPTENAATRVVAHA